MARLPFIPSTEISDTAPRTGHLDLNRLIIARPASTFFMRAAGSHRGMLKGDILVVDRSLPPRRGQLVITTEDENLTAAHWQGQPVVWGVVTYIIRKSS